MKNTEKTYTKKEFETQLNTQFTKYANSET